MVSQITGVSIVYSTFCSGAHQRKHQSSTSLASVKSLLITWWRHQMETFSALLAIRAGNLPVPGEFPTQKPVRRSFDVFFDLRLNKRLSIQWWGWWFETLSRPLWRHRNAFIEKVLPLCYFTPKTPVPCVNNPHDDVIKWKHFPRHWPLCGEFTGPGEFHTQKPVTRGFDVFCDLRLNKRMSKQPWGWWF